MEVVLLDVLDARIAVVANGRDRNSSFQCNGDQTVNKGTPKMILPISSINSLPTDGIVDLSLVSDRDPAANKEINPIF